MLIGQLDAAGREGNFQAVDGQSVAIRLGEFDSLVVFMPFVGHQDCRPECGDPKQGCPPVGYAVDIVDEPAQRRIHLIESADGHHQAAETEITIEIDRSCDDDGGDDRKPAITRRHPCQPCQGHHELVADFQNRGEIALETALFIAFARRQRNRFYMFVDPHQREAQGGFPRIVFAIDLDERAPDEPAHGRSRPGVRKAAHTM